MDINYGLGCFVAELWLKLIVYSILIQAQVNFFSSRFLSRVFSPVLYNKEEEENLLPNMDLKIDN